MLVARVPVPSGLGKDGSFPRSLTTPTSELCMQRWIFNSSTDQAELVEGIKRPIFGLSMLDERYLFQLDRDNSEINYGSTYDTERECLHERMVRFEQAADEYQACVDSAKADRDNCRALARKLRRRIEALPCATS